MVFTEENLLENATVILDNHSACALYVPEYKAIVCTAKKTFIVRADFEALFEAVGEAAKKYLPEKIVFDKRNMQVFDQAAMTWYHTQWKTKLLKDVGLTKHRKLLPDDKLFRKSVAIGREKIAREHAFDFSLFDIRYYESLQEALEN